jgi:hypothetical protein
MISGAAVLKFDAPKFGSRRNPPESTIKWIPPNVASILLRNSEGIGCDASVHGVNSKDPQRTEFYELEGVGDSSTNVADVTRAADDVSCTESFPIDNAN